MQLIEDFKNNYSHMFDFYDNYTFDNKEFLLYAEFNQRNTRYFATKKIEIYAFSNNEHIFVYDTKVFDENELLFIKGFLKKNVESILNIDDEHMSSIITFIVIADEISEEVQKSITKFKYNKSFKLGFKGWVNTKLIVISKSENIAFENKLAKGDSVKLKLI